MLNTLLFALWFFLPAGLANAAPVFAKKIPLLNRFNTPMDFGKSFGERRILGNNKTWRGFIFGVFIAVITLVIQKFLWGQFIWLQQTITTVDYNEVSIWLGVLLGVGALAGDAVESFFKRRARIPSGQSWFPLDQIDYIIGGILLSSLIIKLDISYNIAILLVWFVLHLLSSYIGYLLGLKERPV